MPFELSMLAAAPAVANFAVTSAQTIFDLKQVPENVRVALFTIESTKADVTKALEARVVLGKAYSADDLAEYDRSVSIVETALNDYEKAVESARLNGALHNGKIGGMTRIKWIIRDSKNAETKRNFLVQACLRMQSVTQTVRLRHDLQPGNEQCRTGPVAWTITEAPPPAYSPEIESTLKSVIERLKEDEERMGTAIHTTEIIRSSLPVIQPNTNLSPPIGPLGSHISVRSLSVSHLENGSSARGRTLRSHLRPDSHCRSVSLSATFDQLGLNANENRMRDSSPNPHPDATGLSNNPPVGLRRLTPTGDSVRTLRGPPLPAINPTLQNPHRTRQATRPHRRQQSQDHIPPTATTPQHGRNHIPSLPYPISRQPTVQAENRQSVNRNDSTLPQHMLFHSSYSPTQTNERMPTVTSNSQPSQPHNQRRRQQQPPQPPATNGYSIQRSLARNTPPTEIRPAPYPDDGVRTTELVDQKRRNADTAGADIDDNSSQPPAVEQTYQYRPYRPDPRRQ